MTENMPSAAVKAPYYVANYPTLRQVKLAAVKEGLYHPRLPTFRRMDMDTAGHKLPEEHCRTTTTCGPRDFTDATLTYFQPALQHYAGANVTDTGRSLRGEFRDDLSNMKIDWAKAKEITDVPRLDTKGDLRFTGYAIRYLKPSVSGSWQYTLKQEPMLDQYGQRPLPANIYSRYRDTFPQYCRNIALEAWR